MTRGPALVASLACLALAVVALIMRAGALKELEATQGKLANQSGELEQLIEQNRRLSNELAGARSRGLSDAQFAELMRLRGEVTELRRNAAAAAADKAAEKKIAEAQEPELPPDAVARKRYEHAGFSTPVKSLETVLWSITRQDPKTFLESCTPENRKMFEPRFAEMPEGQMPGGFRNGEMFRAAGFRVLEEKAISENEMGLKVFLEGRNVVLRMKFQRVDGDWKWAGNMIDWEELQHTVTEP
jgi:hypothetical protein